MSVTVITPPSTLPVSRVEAKLHCRIDGGDEDALIDGLVAAATDYVSQYTGRSITAQVLRFSLSDLADKIELPFGPVSEVNSLSIFSDGELVELPAEAYHLHDNTVVRAYGYAWPTTDVRPDAVQIEYLAGYQAVPTSIKQAILLLVGDWYAVREGAVVGSSVSEMPTSVAALLANYRSFAV